MPVNLEPGAPVIVLVNPCAQRAGHPGWRADVSRVLSARVPVSFLQPEGADRIPSVMQDCLENQCQAIVVAGGDGTINRVIQVMAGSDVPLGIIPLGTGNDLARALLLPSTPAAAAERILHGCVRRIDLITVNGWYFATVGLVGLVAQSAVSVSRLKARGGVTRALVDRLGGAAYRVTGFANLIGRRSISTRARLRFREGQSGLEQVVDGLVAGFFIANHPRLGGGLVLPIPARGDDGVFEVCRVPAWSRWRLLYAFTCLMQGWRLPRGVLEVFAADRATIQMGREEPFSADGEEICRGSLFDLAVMPKALGVIC